VEFHLHLPAAPHPDLPNLVPRVEKIQDRLERAAVRHDRHADHDRRPVHVLRLQQLSQEVLQNSRQKNQKGQNKTGTAVHIG